MSTLTTTELELQVDTDLTDSALQQIIDAVERDITQYIGPESSFVIEYDPEFLVLLRLPVQASSIDSAVEYTDGASAPTKTTLSADDYELSVDGLDLRRLSDGTNARSQWSWHVVVTFLPMADVARRKQVAVQLARLEIVHTGYAQENTGDWSATSQALRKERNRILSRLDGSLIT